MDELQNHHIIILSVIARGGGGEKAHFNQTSGSKAAPERKHPPRAESRVRGRIIKSYHSTARIHNELSFPLKAKGHRGVD